MKAFDLLAGVLLIVGGLNWGLVAIAEFDLVAEIVGLSFGETNAASRVIYGLVGIAAVYGTARWVQTRRVPVTGPAAAERRAVPASSTH